MESGFNACLELASLYARQGRYLEALAVYQSPNIKDGLDALDYDRILGYEGDTYHILGNATAERAVLKTMCTNYGDYIACLKLRDLGVQVNLAAADHRADEVKEQDDRLNDQTEAAQRDQAAQDSQDAANRRAAILGAVSSIGASSQSTAASPAPQYGNVQGSSGSSSPAAANQSNAPSSCIWITNSVSVTPLHFEVGQGGNYCTQDKNDAQWEIRNNAGTGVYCRFRNINNGNFIEGQIYVPTGAGQTIDNACARNGQIQYVCYSSDQSTNDACVHGSIAWK